MENKIAKLGLLCLTVLFATLFPACGPAANKAVPGTNTGANADPSTTLLACDDNKINEAILKRVKANPDFNKIIRQINWNSKDCEVELVGYVEFPNDSNTQINERHKAIKKLAWGFSSNGKAVDFTVRDIHDDNFRQYKSDFSQPDACSPPDWEECGDICVRSGTCNNGYMKAVASPTSKP